MTQRSTYVYFYLTAFLFVFHYALPLYTNSSFLSHYFQKNVGILYATAALLALFLLPQLPRLLRAVGNYNAIVMLVLARIILLAGLAYVASPIAVALLFIAAQAMLPLSIVCLDIFLERNTQNKTTGSVRGLLLSVGALAVLVGPPAAGLVLNNTDFWKVYLFSAAVLIPVLALLYRKFRHFEDAHYNRTPTLLALATIWKKSSLRNIFICNFLLQFFYTWMVIYTPIYLHEHMGFDWQTIGFIFVVMLSPFILFEFLIGRLADTRYGEKEMLSLGFVILSIATILLSFITSLDPLVWASVLFITRVGAAMIEVTTESYFFKQVNSSDAHLISSFRNNVSFAYVMGPLAATLLLMLIPFNYLFVFLGIIMMTGIKFSQKLRDTR